MTGQIETASDRDDLAIRAYEQVLKLQARPLAADVALARIYLRRGDASKAITYAQQALADSTRTARGAESVDPREIMSGDMTRAKQELDDSAEAIPEHRRCREAERDGSARLQAA